MVDGEQLVHEPAGAGEGIRRLPAHAGLRRVLRGLLDAAVNHRRREVLFAAEEGASFGEPEKVSLQPGLGEGSGGQGLAASAVKAMRFPSG